MNAVDYCEGYTDEIYTKMRDDQARTEAYRKVIEKYCEGKVVVDIGTGSLALLAIMAAKGQKKKGGKKKRLQPFDSDLKKKKAKAAKVIAMEVNKQAFVSASEVIRQNNLSEKISLYQGYSNELEWPQNEKKSDIIVHEIIGEIASCEGVYYAVEDALNRFLTDSAFGRNKVVSIPYRVQTYLTVVEFPDVEYWQSLPSKFIMPAQELKSINLWNFPFRHFLCVPPAQRLGNEGDTVANGEPLFAKWEDIAFEKPIVLCDELNDFTFEITKTEGVLSGLLTFINVFVDKENTAPELNNHPLHNNTAWPNKLILFKDKISVKKGDVVVVSAKSMLNSKQPSYQFYVQKRV
ncbi:hypothetical protein RFI_04897 [Reticulomyxa filosa]|uniref:Arginine N-methyltransferase n=1 Tax=Reticulomyxa filosa TaxID=46433 RepID=X6P0X5_RETFI|nr:hypothetical protein RFI_04897 [Reticulomyxa filosa]|eukprot:ETO32220.1 hypothetical protein RFI_04897 [Reticulomyxa filosa]